MLSNVDENPPANSNIEPSSTPLLTYQMTVVPVNVIINYSYSRVRYEIVIEKPKRYELWIVSYKLLHDKLAVVYSYRCSLYISSLFHEHSQ